MVIRDRVREVTRSLELVEKSLDLIQHHHFGEDTLSEIKDNAKAVCNEAKTEIDAIKAEIDTWS